ncbi:penicillin acylase family protein [Lysobacter korlensis]|uniref:Penicillin acylase family protein n=1 Tax=Lysobacter korlensis TaxID=553636 RepID=A0ABV6RRK1_9GAMM
MNRRVIRRSARTVTALCVAPFLVACASLPRLDGTASLPGLSEPARIDRDALGVATITAASEADAMRALGYVHAQEQYFEMDLMRRSAAGELAELVGARAVEMDRKHRVHRMRARVERDLETIAGDKRAVLQAYTDGVNAGLADLKSRPWPYLLLRTKPQPWRIEDSALVGYAMFFELEDEAHERELTLWRIKPHLPDALFALLTHNGSQWDAPIVGEAKGNARLPSPEEVDLRSLASASAAKPLRVATPFPVGSNNFAVSGELTADGRAIVAGDTHIGLRAPNIWFRARLLYPDQRAPDGRVDVSGFTLPGVPMVVIGSNTHIAWSFTNGYGDWLDWQRVPACPTSGDAPSEPACAVRTTERIRVARADDVLLEVEETPWGPVMHREPDGSGLALRWVAHLPGSINFALTDFSVAGSAGEAIRMADRVGMPNQNMLVGDRDGRIAWRLAGLIPARDGACVPSPVDAGTGRPVEGAMLEGCTPWTATAVGAPAVVAPASGRLWTANSRVVDGAALDHLGDGGYADGARAAQIRDNLFARESFNERDLLAVQLDDSTKFMQRWWELMQSAAARAQTPALQALVAADPNWSARADTDTVSYRIVRAWRQQVHNRIATGLLAPARERMGAEVPEIRLPQFEGVAWPMVTERPAHLLPAKFSSWDDLFEDAAKELQAALAEKGPLDTLTWGERNTAKICHPLADALPSLVRSRLCMPGDPLPGDTVGMARVQSPDSGAAQRMVVAPGREADGIIHMPGGQSGHPFSPFWGAGHDDWVHGRPTPFLPGPALHSLQLSVPASK